MLHELHTSTMVVLAALHIGWLKFLAVFLIEKKKMKEEILKHAGGRGYYFIKMN